MKTRISFTFAIAVLMLSLTFLSCKRIEVIPQPTPEKLPIVIGVSTNDFDTKANDYTFDINDKVGIYVVDAGTVLAQSGNYVNNMGFTYNGSWTSDSPIYWKDDSTASDFYCYYPYSESITNASSLSVKVNSDQSNEAAYRASDFLWGKTSNVKPSSDAVKITVNHLVSNIKVVLQPGNGFTAEELQQAVVKILSLKTAGTANIADGTIVASGTSEEITPLKENGCYSSFIIPQSISNNPFVKVTIGEREFVLSQTFTFEAGKRYTCTIVTNKTNQGVSIGIGGWVEGPDCGGVVD